MKGSISKRLLAVTVLLLALSGCGSDDPRSLGRDPNDLGVLNPDLATLANALVIDLITDISDAGAETHRIDAKLLNDINGQKVWSDDGKLSSRFILKIGANQFQIALTGDQKEYRLVQPGGAITPQAFMALHEAPVLVASLQSNTDLGRAVNSSKALGLYPLQPAYVPLPQRVITNCESSSSQPSQLYWRGFSSNPFRIEFSTTAKEFKVGYQVTDSSSWRLTSDVFQYFFTAEQLADYETEDPIGGYGSGNAVTDLSLVRRTEIYPVVLETSPRAELKIAVRSIENARYNLRYVGGCGR